MSKRWRGPPGSGRRRSRRPCRGWPPRRRRRRPESRRAPGLPARPTRIPWAIAEVGVPIGPDRERDDRDTAARNVREITRADPAAPSSGRDVAPAPPRRATEHAHLRSWREPSNQGERAVRARSQVDRLRSERRLRCRRGRQQHIQHDHRDAQKGCTQTHAGLLAVTVSGDSRPAAAIPEYPNRASCRGSRTTHASDNARPSTRLRRM